LNSRFSRDQADACLSGFFSNLTFWRKDSRITKLQTAYLPHCAFLEAAQPATQPEEQNRMRQYRWAIGPSDLRQWSHLVVIAGRPFLNYRAKANAQQRSFPMEFF
jgi:hypothetical protein